MNRHWVRHSLSVLAASFLAASAAGARSGAETRVLQYIREHLVPGEPLMVTELYNKVFTQPDERKALDKLYNAFFRIPLFIAQHQEKFGKPPGLEVIAEQFDLGSNDAADTLLKVMESDPRVPRFLVRDPKSGEITSVDVAQIRNDSRFGRILDRQLGGWEGKPAPEFVLTALDGAAVDSHSLLGKPLLLYVWFTGCPPCMRETPDLVALNRELSGLTVIGANADRLLGLDYYDAVRRQYAKEKKIQFPIVHWTREADTAFGNITIFPTLFLIDQKGAIIYHWVGYTKLEELRRAVGQALAGSQP